MELEGVSTPEDFFKDYFKPPECQVGSDIYKAAHITHANAAFDTLSVILPSFYLTQITTNLSTNFSILSKTFPRFLLETLTISVSTILTVTFLKQYLVHLNLTLLMLCVILTLFTRKRIQSKEAVIISTASKNLNFITNARSTINILTAVAILAVDFKIFPRNYHKTERYGISLMDVGVGLYVYANGIVAPEIRGLKNTLKKTFLNVIPLLVIGILRFVVTYMINYQVSVSEYGVHWNFFITLAVTKLFSALIMLSLKNNLFSSMLIGILILTLHQSLLTTGLESVVFSDEKRTNFFLANREGIVSSIGYVGLYFLAVAFGFLIQDRNKKNMFIKLLFCTTLTGLGTIFLHSLFNISRCLANSTYCFWVLFIGFLMTTLYYSLEEFQARFYKNKDSIVNVPLIFEAINYNGLTFFLVANLLTGLVNIIFKTKKVDKYYSLLILVVYMTTTNLIVCFLYIKRIRLKL